MQKLIVFILSIFRTMQCFSDNNIDYSFIIVRNKVHNDKNIEHNELKMYTFSIHSVIKLIK